MSAAEDHLKTRHTELQRRYANLTRRIAALDTDIGRELDSERKLNLQDRRNELAAERNQIAAHVTQIEHQLGISAAVPLPVTPDSQAPSQPVPAASSAEGGPEKPKPPNYDTPPQTTQPGDSSPVETESRLWVWGLGGAATVGILGVLCFKPFACIIEYRLTEAIVGLLVFLAGGAALVFTKLVSLRLRSGLQAMYGGAALALMLLVVAATLLSPPERASCGAKASQVEPATASVSSQTLDPSADLTAGAGSTATAYPSTSESTAALEPIAVSTRASGAPNEASTPAPLIPGSSTSEQIPPLGWLPVANVARMDGWESWCATINADGLPHVFTYSDVTCINKSFKEHLGDFRIEWQTQVVSRTALLQFGQDDKFYRLGLIPGKPVLVSKVFSLEPYREAGPFEGLAPITIDDSGGPTSVVVQREGAAVTVIVDGQVFLQAEDDVFCGQPTEIQVGFGAATSWSDGSAGPADVQLTDLTIYQPAANAEAPGATSRTAAGQVLFEDDFDQYPPSGPWKPEDWTLHQDSSWSTVEVADRGIVVCTDGLGRDTARVGSADWDNYTLEFDMSMTTLSADGEGLFQVRDDRTSNSWYEFQLEGQNWIVYRYLQGNSQYLQEIPVDTELGQWHHVSIRALDGAIELSLDDQSIIATCDYPDYVRRGGVLLGTTGNAQICFDNVRVLAP